MIRLLAILALVTTLLAARKPTNGQPVRSAARYAVIVVVDGARPDMLEPARMPNLRWLLRHGTTYSRATVGQLIAITPPSHATIGTGVFPRRHGVMGFWWKDGTTGQGTRPTDNDQVRAGALDRVISSHHVPSIAAAVKRIYPGGRVVAVSGHKCYAADAMGTPSADYILCSLIYHDRWVAQSVANHTPPSGAVNNPVWDVPIPDPRSGFAASVEQWRLGAENDWVTRYALWAFHRVRYPRVLMVNLPETDVTGHFATNRRWVTARLQAHLNTELGWLLSAYRRAGILDQTAFVLTADHGMSPVRQRLPFSVIDRAIAVSGATKVVLEADTGASLGIREPGKARAVAENIGLMGGNLVSATLYKTLQHGRWAYKLASVWPTISPALQRAYVALADTAASPDGPEVLALYPPGVTTGDRVVNGYHWVGGHLGADWADQHIPLILAGAGVRHGVKSAYPARLVDIAPTVEALMGAPDGGTDGVVLGDAESAPGTAVRRAQARRAAQYGPIVNALQRGPGRQTF